MARNRRYAESGQTCPFFSRVIALAVLQVTGNPTDPSAVVFNAESDTTFDLQEASTRLRSHVGDERLQKGDQRSER